MSAGEAWWIILGTWEKALLPSHTLLRPPNVCEGSVWSQAASLLSCFYTTHFSSLQRLICPGIWGQSQCCSPCPCPSLAHVPAPLLPSMALTPQFSWGRCAPPQQFIGETNECSSGTPALYMELQHHFLVMKWIMISFYRLRQKKGKAWL